MLESGLVVMDGVEDGLRLGESADVELDLKCWRGGIEWEK